MPEIEQILLMTVKHNERQEVCLILVSGSITKYTKLNNLHKRSHVTHNSRVREIQEHSTDVCFACCMKALLQNNTAQDIT